MKQVRYTGEQPVMLPTLNLLASKDDVLTVPDDFEADGFEEVPEPTTADN